MIKLITILLFTISASFAADAPQPALQTAEDAVARFRVARDSDLKASLSPDQRKFFARITARGPALYVRMARPAASGPSVPSQIKT